MSKQYPGGLITKTPVTPAGPYETGAASGVWTLDQQLQYQKQGIWPTQGNVPNYIEDVFSTWLYTGNGSTQTITNGINLAGKGGLVWVKQRDGTYPNVLSDTNQGLQKGLVSNSTAAVDALTNGVTYAAGSATSTGLILGANTESNGAGSSFASWTFRKQPKFFDVVTYTGTGSNTTIAHNLGSVPGCIMVKRTDTTGAWQVYHSSLANTQYTVLNTTAAVATGATRWNSTTPTSSVFSVGTDVTVNESGGTYVAYIYAHNAGGFGLTGTDNVISCGSFTTNGSGSGSVTLGYEPQWWLVKDVTAGGNWQIFDTMRGNSLTRTVELFPDTASAEGNYAGGYAPPNATGFSFSGWFSASSTVIYIAIRRGPMKVPTDATTVFGLNARTGTGANATVTGGQTDDAVLIKNRGTASNNLFASRLTGTGYFVTSSAFSESAASASELQANPWDVMDGVKVGTTSPSTNKSANTFINYLLKRSPSFFDVVCWSGTGTSPLTVNHNLTTAPQMIWLKNRTNTGTWFNDFVVYSSTLGTSQYLTMDTTDAQTSAGTSFMNSTSPTVSNFTAGSAFNESGQTYIAYLFSTCANVSKVGTYTGTGATQTINCGFTGGSRLVLIKRTDSTGDWYVWDTARGMVSGTDPSLLLNSNAAEVNANSVYTATTGFQIVSTAASINASGGTYIYLSIA